MNQREANTATISTWLTNINLIAAYTIGLSVAILASDLLLQVHPGHDSLTWRLWYTLVIAPLASPVISFVWRKTIGVALSWLAAIYLYIKGWD